MSQREIDPASARVILVQSGPRLLPAFPESLSREAEEALRRLAGFEIGSTNDAALAMEAQTWR